MKIERYRAYKNSAVEWLGEIPEYWTLSRIKEKGSVRGRVGWKALKADEYVDEGYIFLSTPNIKNKDIDFANVNYITYERYIESPEIMLQEEDILLTKDGSTLGTINIVTSLPSEATVNSSIAVIRFKKQLFIKYLFYQILSEFIQNKISFKKSGMGVPHLFQRDINNFFIVIPPFPEQKAIAHYLDTKTAQIDRKIDLLTQKANQYGNLKQSLINETVTRGRDRSVPMKDSAIEWIGEVPEHWEIKHLKSLAEIKGGKDSKEVELEEGEYPIYGSGGIFGRASKYLHEKPSVLLGRKGTIDKPLFVTKPFWSVDTMFYTEIKNGIYPKFFYYQCLTIQFGLYQYGSAVPSMAQNVLRQILFATPPLSEQKEIATYLDTKTAQIDQIIQTINTQIEKLKELRKTLINDVVTGKIKVTED